MSTAQTEESVEINFFGRDSDLLSQALRTLADAGLTVDFWRQVGKGGPLVTKMAELYKTLAPLTEEHKVAIREWVEQVSETDCPFEEPLTYNAIDGDSSHRRFGQELQRSEKLQNLFERATHNAAAREACELLLIYFHLLYVFQSVRECCQPAESRPGYKGHPVAGLKETLPALMNGSRWIFFGDFLNRTQFAKDRSVQIMCRIAKRVPDPGQLELVDMFFQNQGEETLKESREALRDAHDRLLRLVE